VCFQVLALIQSNPAYQRLYRRHAGPWYSHAEDGCHRMDRSPAWRRECRSGQTLGLDPPCWDWLRGAQPTAGPFHLHPLDSVLLIPLNPELPPPRSSCRFLPGDTCLPSDPSRSQLSPSPARAKPPYRYGTPPTLELSMSMYFMYRWAKFSCSPSSHDREESPKEALPPWGIPPFRV